MKIDTPDILVLTGAGASQASGLFTYRGPGGLYEGTQRKRRASQVEFLAEGDEAVWGHFGDLRRRVLAAQPNPVHLSLAQAEAQGVSLGIVTQNVDGLHQRAGSTQVLELHGSVHRVRCLDPSCPQGAPARALPFPPELPDHPGVCSLCQGRLRPDIVLFGEALSPEAYELSRLWIEGAKEFWAVGTSGQSGSARRLLRRARVRGIPTRCLDLAPRLEARWSFDVVYPGDASRLLPRILASRIAEGTLG